MKHIDIADLFKQKQNFTGKNITVCGWVRTSRDSKNTAFLEINDGTTLNHLQLVIDKDKINCGSVMPIGTSLKADGVLVQSLNDKDGIELNVSKVDLLGACPPEYPLQKKRHSLEYLRTILHLRVRTNTFNAMFRIRSVLSEGIHKFFTDRNFTYAHTPIITGSDCEGAGEVFKVTSIGFSKDFKTEEDYLKADFFGQSAGLTVSGQLEGEVMAMAFGKIYTFGPTFRAENSNTARHLAEFWQIEPEVAFFELSDIMELAESFIKFIIRYVLDKCKLETEFFEKHFESGLTEKLTNVLNSEFIRLEYKEAIEVLQRCGRNFTYPVKWGNDLQTEHERYLTDELYKKPVFVVNYPKELKSFYMKQNADGKTVAATDLLVPGVGEIIGCSEREDNYDKLKKTITERKMKLKDYANYLELRKFGSVPHSGFGLGLERMLMYITGIGNIRDTAIFPRAKDELR
ncbi:MAG: asparagine--tRNA ligase [Firmicutes bacterium]|nr:asparagine--tRNA ligase [Bacillota bacterium]